VGTGKRCLHSDARRGPSVREPDQRRRGALQCASTDNGIESAHASNRASSARPMGLGSRSWASTYLQAMRHHGRHRDADSISDAVLLFVWGDREKPYPSSHEADVVKRFGEDSMRQIRDLLRFVATFEPAWNESTESALARLRSGLRDQYPYLRVDSALPVSADEGGCARPAGGKVAHCARRSRSSSGEHAPRPATND